MFSKKILSVFCMAVFALTASGNSSDSLSLKKDRDYWINRYSSVSFPVKTLKVSSTYGIRKDPFTKKKVNHNGLDLKANYENVYSMFDGTVEKIGSDNRSGNYVTMRYGAFTVSYCHLSRKYVNVGDTVWAGDPIAVSGNTGRSTGPHLHLTVKKNGKLYNPHTLLLYIKKVKKECVAALGGESYVSEPWSCSDFISRFAAMAMDHQRRYGIPASVTLAQMALESDWGQSELATNGNNYFGIKATRKWVADGKPYSEHDDEKRNEKFCNYASVEESVEHHSKLLTSKRYQRFCSFPATDYQNWLRGLIKAGYASGKGYVASCEKIIKQYNLHKYDIQANKF